MGFLSHDYDPFTHVVNYRGSECHRHQIPLIDHGPGELSAEVDSLRGVL